MRLYIKNSFNVLELIFSFLDPRDVWKYQIINTVFYYKSIPAAMKKQSMKTYEKNGDRQEKFYQYAQGKFYYISFSDILRK